MSWAYVCSYGIVGLQNTTEEVVAHFASTDVAGSSSLASRTRGGATAVDTERKSAFIAVREVIANVICVHQLILPAKCIIYIEYS